MPGLTLRQEIVVEFFPFMSLSTEERFLVEEAVKARVNAQAPYSRFKVGAALWSTQGDLFGGCNVERADYSGTSHAEQAAIDAMVFAGDRQIKVIALAAAHEDIVFDLTGRLFRIPEGLTIRSMVPPCGGCLQKIWENCHGDLGVIILSVMPEGGVFRTTIGDTFPAHFDLSGVYGG